MKKLFISTNRTEVGLLGGLLEEAGIEFEVRNEFTNATYPIEPFWPELWIIHDADIVRAAELRDAWRDATPSVQGPWVCPACGEESEAQFTSCWKCGAGPNDPASAVAANPPARPASASRPERASRWTIGLLFALGAGFIACFVWNVHTIYTVEQWPYTPAVVARSDLSITQGLREGFGGTHVVRATQVVFAFTYAVDGLDYTSQRFCFWARSPGRQVIWEYPRGRRFQALFNPDNPAEAVVEPGLVHYPLLAGGVVLLLWSLALMKEVFPEKR